MPSRRVVNPGDRFGELTVLHQEGDDTHCRRQSFLCQCRCGRVCVVKRGLLIRPLGGSKSCGCVRQVNSGLAAKKACTRHGQTHTREYRIWAHMVDRCTKPGRSDAERYYNRGIRVHEEWIGPGGFEKFLCHIGSSPSSDHSVDRIDNNSGYVPGNVRWATKKQQARNRRSSRFVTAFGKTLTVAEWSDETGIKPFTIINRLALGWPPEVSLTRPLLKGGHENHRRPR